METKKVKTLLFAGLIAALIAALVVPLSGISFAETDEDEKYAIEDIKTAMIKADPYIVEFSYMLIFDIEAAQHYMLREEIQIINDFVEMQNKYVLDYKTYNDKKPQFDAKLEEKFTELKDSIQSSNLDVTEVTLFTNWLIPEIHADTGDVCDGSSSNPHSEYVKKTIATHTTKQTAKNDAVAKGYHVVPIGASYLGTIDYALFTTEYNCNTDAFRNQIVITQSGNDWILQKQIKEPNPEITAYTHPVWWWTFYTVSWHASTTNPVIGDW